MSLATIAALLAACAAESDAGARATTDLAERPVVAVPLVPIAGLVDALVPEGSVDIVVLIPPGSNPSTYEPRLGDLRRAADAGLYLEMRHPAFVFERTWLAGLLDSGLAERVPLFLDCPTLPDDEHVWVSANCLALAAGHAAAALAGLLPSRAAEVQTRLATFLSRLAAADSVADQTLEPYRGSSFLVLHPAWGYLAAEYDLDQIEILSHGTGDPGASRLAEIIRLGRSEGIRVVYVQPQFNQGPARVVAAELGADLVSIDPLGRDPVAVIESASAALAAGFVRGGE